MNNYSIRYPKEIIFGQNSIEKLTDLLPKNSNILLVVGKHFNKSEEMTKIKSKLDGVNFIIADTVSPEPTLDNVNTLIELGRKHQLNTVVAIGGGSVIDAAKAAAAIIPLSGNVDDYFNGTKQLKQKGLFFIAAPTTAGTGAEITKNSVLTDPSSSVKKSLRHQDMIADIAIIDSALTLSAPPHLTAASGLDALTQAIEAFTTVKANSITKSLAATAVEKIIKNLKHSYNNPLDPKSREELAEGSLMSAMAFSQSGLGAVHGLAHPIGSLLKIPHGITCAILLTPILKLNQTKANSEYAKLAKICKKDANAEEFIKLIQTLCQNLNIPKSFSEYNLTKKHYPFILKNCRSNSMNGNPCHLSDETITELLNELMG